MSNTTNALGHSITVTGISATRTFDTRQNVKKRLFSFRFNTGIPNSGINMAYASVDEINADNNLFISDKSTSINENSPGFLIEEETFLGKSYTTFFKNFLLTDVFTPAETTRPSEPLYFKHQLDSSVDENSISVLDKNFNPIDGSLYVIEKPYTYSIVDGDPNDGSDGNHPLEYEAVYVYNNLEHSFDEDTGDYEVYYVSHVDATTGDVVNELLSNQNVFNQAGFGDIWVATSQLKPWGKAYLIEESNGTYDLTIPTTGTYSIKSLDAARVYIEEPVTKESTDHWFVRITNGSFRTSYNSLQYVYSLPEFSAQNFNPIEPYKLIINESSQRITNNLIKLNHNKIYYSQLLHFHIDIVITDEEDNPVFAITTDPERLGTNYIDSIGTVTDIMWDDTYFDSLDARHGFVYLSAIIKDTYNIITTYYFKEEYYEFTTLNFNPTQNSSILTERIVLYLVPENSTHNNNAAHTGALHFLKVASDGLITFTSQDGSDGNENLKTGFEYMLEAGSRHSANPGGLSHIFWVNSPEINMGMYYDAMPVLAPDATSPSDPAGVAHVFAVYPKPGLGIETFMDTFTVNASTGKEGLDKRYIVLGEIFVNDYISPDDVKILDTRVRGGGVREDRLEEALQKNPEVQWYNDIGIYDGKPFPGTSAVVVKIPYTILDEYGGILSRKQVREIVKRHMALGSEPVIRYEGVIPYLTSIVPGENKLTIQWDSEGSSYGYNVYYSISKDGPYVKYNSSLITDNALGNELEMTGLTNRIKHWVTAAAVNIASGLEGPRAVALIARPELIPKKLKDAMGHSVSVVI